MLSLSYAKVCFLMVWFLIVLSYSIVVNLALVLYSSLIIVSFGCT